MMMRMELVKEVGAVQMLKPIDYKNINSAYKIDEYGNVYSEYKKGFMTPVKDKDGYLKLSLRGKDKYVYVRIATLVAYTFIGSPPCEMRDATVDHIDGNILNNYYQNLRWVERGENSSIRQNRGIGEENHEAKLKEWQVVEICELLMENELSLREIGNIYGVSRYTINNIRQQANWKNISQKYDFPESKRKFGSTNKEE